MRTKKFKFKQFYCQTYGNGFWSDVEKKVKVTKIAPDTVWPGYITFKAFFNKSDWNTNKHGLIYTDSNWIRDFRKNLIKLGISPKIANSIDYTEQGMQGDNYVSVETDNNKFAKEMGWEFEEE